MQTPNAGPDDRRSERSERDDSQQAALLIDFDNVTMGIRSNLGQEFRKLLGSEVIRGNVAVQRAYADWRRYPQYIVPLSEASIDLIFAPAYGSSKKNATDIRLAIDALELVFTRPEIRTFILMSGDSDFSSLVLKLKEYGKYVIGVGIQESSSDLLVQNCDEYYSYSALTGLSKAGEEPRERHDPWVLVEKAILKMVERNDTMRSDRLKQVMLEFDSSFNEKDLGYSKFNRFVVEAASRGLLTIQKMDAGQYGVAPGEKAGRGREPAAAAGKAAESRQADRDRGRRSGGRRGRSRGKRRPEKAEPDDRTEPRERTGRARPHLTKDSAFDLLNNALDRLLDDSEDSVRDSDVKRRMLELREDFDEGELGFNKFSKFLQEADEAGLIELTKGPSGNYHVSRPARRDPRRRPEPEKADQVRDKTPAARGEDAPPSETDKSTESRQSAVRRLAQRLFGSARTEPAEPETKAESSKPTAPTEPQPEPPKVKQEEARGDANTAEARGGRGRGRKRETTGSEAGGDGPQRTRGRPERREKREDRQRDEARRTGEDRTEKATRSESREARSGATEGDGTESDRKVRSDEDRAAVESEAPAESVGDESTGSRGERGARKASPSDAPRGTIRGRWGTSGRYRPPEAPPPILEGQTAGRSRRSGKSEATAGSAPSSPPESQEEATDSDPARTPQTPAEIVAYLRSRYAGVGERTAEALVEAFGSDVFRVMDEEPDRIRQVLPDHRADRVLDARKEELRAAGG